jgi:hypothetical protein
MQNADLVGSAGLPACGTICLPTQRRRLESLRYQMAANVLTSQSKGFMI